MNIKNIFWRILFAGVLGTSFAGTLSWGQPKAGEEVNLIMEEMTVLDQAFKTIIDGVVLGDMERIKPAMMGVYEARERIERALKAGQKVILPKNQGQIREFIRLDDQFHSDLEDLTRAAETGQRKVVKNYAHRLLDSCVVCHEKFRR
jgi:cytochrome c556